MAAALVWSSLLLFDLVEFLFEPWRAMLGDSCFDNDCLQKTTLLGSLKEWINDYINHTPHALPMVRHMTLRKLF